MASTGTSPVHRRLLRWCWRHAGLRHELARHLDSDALHTAATSLRAPAGDDPGVRLLGLLADGLAGEDLDPSEAGAAAATTPDVELRRVVAARLVDHDQPDPAWAVLAPAPGLWLDASRMARLIRDVRDAEALDQIVAETSARLTNRRTRTAVRLHRDALITRGRVPYRAWEAAEALRWFDRAHEEVGPHVRTWTWRAKALRRLGRLEEARLNGERALAERPDWVPALVHLGNLYHQLGDRPSSVDCWRRLLDTGKASAYHLTRTWNGLLRVRELELALRAADQLAERTGDQPGTRALRAVTLWELGRVEDAEAALADLRDRDDVAVLKARAWFLGRTQDAMGAYELLRQLPPEDWGTDSAEELYHMLRRDGHLDLADEIVRDAAEVHPEHDELRRLRREIAGELQVFRGEWRPASVPATVERTPGRILHVVGRSVPYASSGYCVRTDHTVRAQRAAGLDVHVATQLGFPWEEGKDAPLREEVGGVAHHRLPFPADVRFPLALDERLDRHVEALSQLVERLRPAVLHAASDFRNALVGLEVAERFDLPVIYEMRGFWEETWLAKRGETGMASAAYQLRRQRETDAAARATHVFTLAPTMRDELVARGIDAAKISLAPNAVDANAFETAPHDDALAARLGIAPEQVVVGYVSSFSGYEGINVLIDALGRLHEDGGGVHGLLVGDGEVRPELERQARDLGLDEVVTFTGRVPHSTVRGYYGLIDVFVVPRTNARVCQLVSPLKPYEAMAAGKAVVVSGTPVLRTIVEDGVTGATFEPGDPDDLAARIRELAADADLRARLGETARRHVLEHHTWERNAERYLEVYRALGVAPLRSERTA